MLIHRQLDKCEGGDSNTREKDREGDSGWAMMECNAVLLFIELMRWCFTIIGMTRFVNETAITEILSFFGIARVLLCAPPPLVRS